MLGISKRKKSKWFNFTKASTFSRIRSLQVLQIKEMFNFFLPFWSGIVCHFVVLVSDAWNASKTFIAVQNRNGKMTKTISAQLSAHAKKFFNRILIYVFVRSSFGYAIVTAAKMRLLYANFAYVMVETFLRGEIWKGLNHI